MTRYHDSVVRYQAAPSWVQWCTKTHLFMGHRSKKWKRQLFEVSKSMLENFNNAMYVHPRKNCSEHLCSQKLMLLCASWYWLQRVWICLLQSWKPWTWEKGWSKYLKLRCIFGTRYVQFFPGVLIHGVCCEGCGESGVGCGGGMLQIQFWGEIL